MSKDSSIKSMNSFILTRKS